MTDLSPGSRNILTEGVRALEPSQAARDRIRAGVAARIAVLPGAGGAGEGGQAAGGASATSGAAGTIFKASLLAVIGAVVVGGGVMWFAGGDNPVVPTAARAPAVAAPAPEPASGPAAPEPAAPADVPAAASEDRGTAPVAARRKAAESRRDGAAKRPSQASSVSDNLAREVRLLDRARRALTDGDPDAARAALARYRREIASPQMERESLLLRAETQCAAAETAAGLRTLAEVRRRWPGASGVNAVRALCREAAR